MYEPERLYPETEIQREQKHELQSWTKLSSNLGQLLAFLLPRDAAQFSGVEAAVEMK